MAEQETQPLLPHKKQQLDTYTQMKINLRELRSPVKKV